MDLTPAAWDFLVDVARQWGMSWARVLRDEMVPPKGKTEGFITHLDDEPVLMCDKPDNFIGTKVTPAHRQEALL